MDEQRLRAPQRRPQPIARTANTSPEPTPEQLARLNLLRQMKRVRLVLPEDLARYLDRHWDDAGVLDSQALQIATIEDFRAYQTLVTLALRSQRKGGLRREDPLHRLLRGFRVELAAGEAADASVDQSNPYLHSPRFVLRRTGTHAPMKATRTKDITA